MKKISLSWVIAMVMRLHRKMGEHMERQSGTESEGRESERWCVNEWQVAQFLSWLIFILECAELRTWCFVTHPHSLGHFHVMSRCTRYQSTFDGLPCCTKGLSAKTGVPDPDQWYLVHHATPSAKTIRWFLNCWKWEDFYVDLFRLRSCNYTRLSLHKICVFKLNQTTQKHCVISDNMQGITSTSFLQRCYDLVLWWPVLPT